MIAELDPAALPALATLVTATVFSTTFLTTRVHRERGRATDRALKLDELIASSRREGKPLDADWFEDQQLTLEETLHDKLALLVIGMNTALATAVVTLAVAFGLSAGTDWGRPQGWALLAFAGTAVLVLLVGAVDVLSVRSDVRRRLGDTPMGQVVLADRMFRRLTTRRSARPEELGAARVAAVAAVRASHGLFGQAWAVLGEIELVNLRRPSEPDHLLRAGRAFDRAIEVGPATSGMWAARAFVHEQFGEFEKATVAWLRALELYSGAAIAELRPDDPSIEDVRSLARVAAEDKGAYGWRFRPGRPETFANALEQLPALDLRARATGELLARAAVTHSDVADVAVRGLREWLDQVVVGPGGWLLAQQFANQLATGTDAPAVRSFLTEYQADKGPIGLARAAEQERHDRAKAEFEEFQQRSAERQREMERILRESEREQEESAAEWEVAEQRRKRIERGEGTDEDRAWEEQTIEEALAITPEQSARERADAEAEWKRFQSERAAFEVKMRIQDAELARLRQEMDRRARMAAGRATAEDMAREVSRGT